MFDEIFRRTSELKKAVIIELVEGAISDEFILVDIAKSEDLLLEECFEEIFEKSSNTYWFHCNNSTVSPSRLQEFISLNNSDRVTNFASRAREQVQMTDHKSDEFEKSFSHLWVGSTMINQLAREWIFSDDITDDLLGDYLKKGCC